MRTPSDVMPRRLYVALYVGKDLTVSEFAQFKRQARDNDRTTAAEIAHLIKVHLKTSRGENCAE